jgi:hypothetical protein
MVGARPPLHFERGTMTPLTRFRTRQLICPSCHRVAGHFACDVGQIRSTFPRVSRPPRGAYRDRHGRWARDAMAAGLRTRRMRLFRGRQSRVVLTPRRWREVLKKLTLLRDDGDKKPDRRRERGISRKVIAQGMPDRFGQPVVTNSCAFYFCARGCGRAKRPAFPAPSAVEGSK